MQLNTSRKKCDFVFISMPYAKFDSRWFANVPNINLGLVEAFLREKGRGVKTYHFHLMFRGFLGQFDDSIGENFLALSQTLGVEFLGLDYVFSTLFFEKHYLESRDRFGERLEVLQLDLDMFEELRDTARRFIEGCFTELAPALDDAKLIGFSCSHYQLSASLLLASKVKEAHPHIKTLFGGKDCSGTFASELLSQVNSVDYVGIGECEITVLSLLDHVEDTNKPLVNVVHRNGSGQVVQSPLKENIGLETLPFPVYDLSNIPFPVDDVILPVELGRGCPWKQCTFCPDKSYNITCQSKTLTYIKKEFDYYCKSAKALRNFIILDSDALKAPELIIALSSYLEERGLAFHFGEFRAERMTREVLRALFRLGRWVTPFQVGVETFSDGILALMNKGVTALKNVEVIKGAVELDGSLQFNLFTCYPNITWAHMEENLEVMDKITHLLVHTNIEAYPGEFYLPTDCPVFLETEAYGLTRNEESVFADVYEEFPMPSYSNYPYPYEFDNSEEQMEMATALRDKVDAIKAKNPREHYMVYEENGEGLTVSHCKDGKKKDYDFYGADKGLYLAAVEELKSVKAEANKLGIPVSEATDRLQSLEEKGLVLLSSKGDSYLSLATKKND